MNTLIKSKLETSLAWTQMRDDLANSMWTNVCIFIYIRLILIYLYMHFDLMFEPILLTDLSHYFSFAMIYSSHMATSADGGDMIPECLCGGGKMSLFCAGPDAKHNGRWYYKCPINSKHSGYFLWCDDYHSKHGDGKMPNYVLNQVYRLAKAEDISVSEAKISTPVTTEVSSASDTKRSASVTAAVCSGFARCEAELRMNYVLCFIGLMLLLLGIVLGKLF